MKGEARSPLHAEDSCETGSSSLLEEHNLTAIEKLIKNVNSICSPTPHNSDPFSAEEDEYDDTHDYHTRLIFDNSSAGSLTDDRTNTRAARGHTHTLLTSTIAPIATAVNSNNINNTNRYNNTTADDSLDVDDDSDSDDLFQDALDRI